MGRGFISIGAKGGGYCAGYFAPSGATGLDLTPHAVMHALISTINTNFVKKKFHKLILIHSSEDIKRNNINIPILRRFRYP